jgi:hypothetical protein
MKTYKIQCFDEHNNLYVTFISQHIDASRHVTAFFENSCANAEAIPYYWKNAAVLAFKPKQFDELYLSENIKELRHSENIDHFNIIDGMITLYYQSGKFIEITSNNKPFFHTTGTYRGVKNTNQKY